PRVLHGAHDPAMDVADQHEHRVLEFRRTHEALERQLIGHFFVVTVHDREYQHEERNDDHHDPGALLELRHGQGQEDDAGHHGPNPVDVHPPAPACFPQPQPATDHAAL